MVGYINTQSLSSILIQRLVYVRVCYVNWQLFPQWQRNFSLEQDWKMHKTTLPFGYTVVSVFGRPHVWALLPSLAGYLRFGENFELWVRLLESIYHEMQVFLLVGLYGAVKCDRWLGFISHTDRACCYLSETKSFFRLSCFV